MSKQNNKIGQTINYQILKWMLIIVLIPILSISFYHLQAYDKSFKQQSFAMLDQIADKKTYQIEQFLADRIRDAQLAALVPTTREAINALGPMFKQRLDNEKGNQKILNRYGQYLQPFLESGYYDIFLISPTRDIVFSLKQEDDLHTNLTTGIYADTALAESVKQAFLLQEPSLSAIKYYPPSKELAAFISAPVLEKNLIIGVIAFQVDMKSLRAIVDNNTGLGLSGDTNIVTIDNQQAIFLNHPHKTLKSIQSEVNPIFSFSEAMQKALQGNTGHMITFDHFRNEEVLASYRYLPDLSAEIGRAHV